MSQVRLRTGFPNPQDLGITRSSYLEYEEAWSSVTPEQSPFSLQFNLPSTAHNRASIGYMWFTLMRENASSAWATFIDTPHDLLEEARTLSGVNVAQANANVFEIRRITGLAWGDLADMLNVDRRTVHNWIKGGRVRYRNQKRIADTLATLRRIDQGSAQDNLVLLRERSPRGATIFELFKRTMYQEVLRVAPSSVGVRPAASQAERTGEYQAIAIHRGADGSETVGSLPFEPQPPGRKRELRRA